MLISIIIPVYQSEKSLKQVVSTVVSEFTEHFSLFEVICVDDGSQDDSWQVIKMLNGSFPQVRGIKLSRNFGQWPATICGLKNAKGNILIIMDDDGQASPRDALKLISLIRDNQCDVACGVRKLGRNIFINWIHLYFFNKKLTSSLVAMKRRIIFDSNGVAPQLGMGLDPYLRWILSPSRTAQIEVPYQKRIRGNSGYGFIGKMKFVMVNCLSYLGLREIMALSALMWILMATLISMIIANEILIVFLGLFNLAYYSERSLNRKGKPYYWVLEEWPSEPALKGAV